MGRFTDVMQYVPDFPFGKVEGLWKMSTLGLPDLNAGACSGLTLSGASLSTLKGRA